MKRRILLPIGLVFILTSSALGHMVEPIKPIPQEMFKKIEISSFEPAKTPDFRPFTDFSKEKGINNRNFEKLPDISAKIEQKTPQKAQISAKMPSKTDAQRYALARLGQTQYNCIYKLFKRESNWRWNALNRSSGAYGIPQALPGSKMALSGSDWKTNPITQVKWGLRYIKGRYGTACNAWRHSQNYGWY